MDTRKLNSIIVFIGIYAFSLPFIDASENLNCTGKKCLGPTKFYEELGCKPDFKASDECCPARYICDYFKDPPVNKCVINGHEYASGELLREEDKNPCDYCTCNINSEGYGFTCAVASCYIPLRPGCHYGPSVRNCCTAEEVCPPSAGNGISCTVNGTIYGEGEEFIPADDPDKRCYCSEGLTDENIESFCVTPKHTWCGNVLFNVWQIRRRCSPVYYANTSPQRDCNRSFRCQRDDDVIVRHPVSSEITEFEDPDMLCKFGNLTLRVGDRLNRSSDAISNCIECVCEVPPVLTCRGYNSEDCGNDK